MRPAYGSFETWDKSGFKYSDEYVGKTFAVKKVTVKDVEINKKPNKEVTIEVTEVGGKTKIKFKGYDEVCPFLLPNDFFFNINVFLRYAKRLQGPLLPLHRR